jgi:uncharacterized membrane protein YgdD (TMEM256/DUF423 family)
MKKNWQMYYSAMAALICAATVALSAYASHGLQGEFKERMLMACYFAFAHGLSLIVLSRHDQGRSNLLACTVMLLGIFLFSGSLALAALWQTSTALAPSGGIALILAWCLVAVNFLVRRDEE